MSTRPELVERKVRSAPSTPLRGIAEKGFAGPSGRGSVTWAISSLRAHRPLGVQSVASRRGFGEDCARPDDRRSREEEIPLAERENKAVVARLWQALYAKDWEGVAASIAERGHYEDVPTPDPGSTGPVNVVKRLRVGLDPVERFEHAVHRVVAEGDVVVVEHTETWHFATGEQLTNDFVTVHE